MSSPLIEKYGAEKRWLNWRLETRDGKTTKIPYMTKSKKGSSTDPKTWTDYENAATAADNGSNKFDGVGIVLHDSKLICIDIDHVVVDGKVFSAVSEKILKLLKAANSFTEISQSGTGLHIFLALDKPYSPVSNKKAPFEIYSNGRYIATTNKPYGKKALPLRTIDEAELLQILKHIDYPWNTEDEIPNESATSETSSIKGEQEDLTDEQLLDKMFRSKNGEEIKKLYNGDITAHDNDTSKADMSLLAHLAFWSRKNGHQMERLWMASPLGNREKTIKRKDYRTRSIANALKKCKTVYTVPEDKLVLQSPTLDLLFTLDNKGNKIYMQNTENMARILRKYPVFADRFRYDEFRNIMEIKDFRTNEWRGIIDSDAIMIQTKISILFPYFGKVGKEMVYDAMIHVSRENTFDSALAYITALKWDQVPRLDTWLTSTYHVEDNEYHRAVGANWMKGLVGRLVYPGSKFDYVLVLEGEQGTKKSTSLSILGQMTPKYNLHIETTMSTDSKDFFMQFQGKAIIEFSEGETLSRTEVKRMKAIITTPSDKYRPAYGRMSEDFPRRCVFAMTTNQSEYLKDETGNRRWLPVACEGNADIDWLKENKDQLFAEAYHRLVIGKETTHEFPEEATRKAQASRRISDPNTELIMNWYINNCPLKQKEDGVSIQDVYAGAFLGNFSGNGKGLDRAKEMTIATVLKDELGLEKRRTSLRDVQAVRYFDDARRYIIKTELEELMNPMPTIEQMTGAKKDIPF